jgi:hypothetical protein
VGVIPAASFPRQVDGYDRRVAIMPARGQIQPTLNALQASTDPKVADVRLCCITGAAISVDAGWTAM